MGGPVARAATGLAVAVACALGSPGCASPGPTVRPAAAEVEPAASFSLVESVPVETTLDHRDIPDAWEVWPKMIAAARRSIDFAEFYASDAPGSRLSPVIEEIERAAARGVRVRFLADAMFAEKYPETLERLASADVEVRRFDVEATMGGVLHAKYFVVDGEEIFVGSQNFDYRALEHIQEMGVRVRSAPLARSLSDVFETDWAIAGGAARETRVRSPRARLDVRVTSTGERIRLVASPKDWLPDESSWDLPAIEALVRGARKSVDVQVLLYKPAFRDGSPFARLDDALRAAVRSGVRVRLLVSDWSTKPDARVALDALARAGVDVKVITIPPWSGGPIPFSRVSHAKYMVVDGERSWVGTSNWEGDYFFRSRNVGVVVEGAATARALSRVFDDGFAGAYAKPLAETPVTGR
jgi:phosphatidylserine/phosphatidylglycerophosphate/cardiolipin synthase-like enzyme